MIQAFDVQVNVSRTAQRSVRRPALAGWHIWHRHLHTQLLTPTSPEEKRPKICPKIEKPQALTNIDGIIAESQALMAARGDLGVELELERVAKDAGLFVINATQMVETVESMIESPVPTRAEVSDLQNAIWDGFACELEIDVKALYYWDLMEVYAVPVSAYFEFYFGDARPFWMEMAEGDEGVLTRGPSVAFAFPIGALTAAVSEGPRSPPPKAKAPAAPAARSAQRISWADLAEEAQGQREEEEEEESLQAASAQARVSWADLQDDTVEVSWQWS
ncbi:pyk [Symbiodinium sp. CCMP2592]|nr:pyk [Symbiodinium sp. CCMP2592]CAE7723966.1 pyk [Symbiodinium sp. CCMP2592]